MRDIKTLGDRALVLRLSNDGYPRLRGEMAHNPIRAGVPCSYTHTCSDKHIHAHAQTHTITHTNTHTHALTHTQTHKLTHTRKNTHGRKHIHHVYVYQSVRDRKRCVYIERERQMDRERGQESHLFKRRNWPRVCFSAMCLHCILYACMSFNRFAASGMVWVVISAGRKKK